MVYFLGAQDEVNFEYALRGKAWNVYWLLLKNDRPMSVREVQRMLHFSSPSVASHHLEQLRDLGLVQKQASDGNYVLVREVKIGVLRHFVKLGKLLFPRYFFYAVFSTACVAVYFFMLSSTGVSPQERLFVVLFGVIVSAIFWYEAVRLWLLRPF